MKFFLAAMLMLALLPSCGSAPNVAESAVPIDAILTTSPGGFVRFGPHYFEFTKFVFETDADDSRAGSVRLMARLGNTENYLIVPVVAGKPMPDVQLVYQKSILPVLNVRFDAGVLESVRIRGRLETGVPLLAHLHSSAGSSIFRLDGNLAYLNGELGSGTFRQVKYLIAAHPEVDTIVFENVPGSLNDDINVHTGRLIREAGFSTLVPADGLVASGGVALFCAGIKRTIEPGARIGVHAWSIPGDDVNPTNLSRNHHAHRSPLKYFREMLDLGEEFYFFTLQAAPFAAVHWMTPAEIEKFGLASIRNNGSDRSN